MYKFPGLIKTWQKSLIEKCQTKIPELSRISKARTNPVVTIFWRHWLFFIYMYMQGAWRDGAVVQIYVSPMILSTSSQSMWLLVLPVLSDILPTASSTSAWNTNRETSYNLLIIFVLYSWTIHFTLTVPLFTQEYKWVPANCQGSLTKMLEGNLEWTSIPSRGSSNTQLVASCYGNTLPQDVKLGNRLNCTI